jgi:uncharacterized protein
MLEYQFNSQSKLHPTISVLLIILLAGTGFVVGGIAGVFASLPFYDGTEADLMLAIQDIEAHPEVRYVLFVAQVGATIGGLLLAPLIFLRTQRQPVSPYFAHNRVPFFIFMVAGLTIIVSFGLNSLFLQWNQNLEFPEFLKGFEEWARAREEEAATQTEILTRMTSTADLLIAILVIAVLPALGEEFVFRGLIQNELHRGTGNIHVSIWIAAIIFSAIHFQFFGFLPRMMLGALFGYLYYWSGNIWVPIFAHFVNNAIQITALYYYQQGAFEFDLENPDAIPARMVILSTALTAGLLYYLYRYFKNYKPEIQST